ncbi:MAG: site-2 protease family protein [Planctomycetota bacterium]|nr:MAG: site-2 protease family protein [Planctomycetota bacterium]
MVLGLIVSALSLYTLRLAEGPVLVVPEGDGASGASWGVIAGGLIVVLFSLTIHEAAHAITAWWLGDDYARSLGRVTLNPLAHIDLFGTIILPLLLVLAHGPVFGYARPVPVRVESLPRYRRAHILISIAGPGSNLMVAAVSLMLLLGAGCLVRLLAPQAVVEGFSSFDLARPVHASGFMLAPLFAAFATVMKLSFFINVFLAMFNLIPIPPLDGSWVLEHLFPRTLGRLYANIRPFGFLIFLAAIYFDLFEILFFPVLIVLYPGLGLVGHVTGFA